MSLGSNIISSGRKGMSSGLSLRYKKQIWCALWIKCNLYMTVSLCLWDQNVIHSAWTCFWGQRIKYNSTRPFWDQMFIRCECMSLRSNIIPFGRFGIKYIHSAVIVCFVKVCLREQIYSFGRECVFECNSSGREYMYLESNVVIAAYLCLGI